ncbi:hypothetical protein S7711_09924 [Stachybotrys chartarum IBT 7711]|uniref:HTH CENPB-type domain-containing protein n=1 Tax=Stachybotrys chartarum (strain CBS 109288 / IBT 7711) TaxID=1280523 RepID=A0A084BB62_STACB|nr:hypothetical protein S7711_09924 [Stachybotrys chartarum IBT 7711]
MARQMTDREIHIQNAIDFVRAGGKIRHGAREFRVPESTLRDRLRGRVSLNWILAEERAGRAPMKAQVLAFAESIAAINGKAGPFGNNWVDRFLQRNEEVQTKVSQALEALRALSTTEDHVRAHIRRLTQLQLERNFTPSNTYNADETGITEGESAAGRVIGTSLKKDCAVVDADRRQWVTILGCGNASGRVIDPCVIFTGDDLQGQWFPTHFPHWGYECSQTGWNNICIFKKWLLEIFIPQTTPENPSYWRLLIIDGCFSPLKTAFHAATRAFASFNTTAPASKKRFIEAYRKALDIALTFSNVRAGFRASGIYPLSEERAVQDIIEAKMPPKAVLIPQTPRKQQPHSSTLWNTPSNSQDLQAQLTALEDGVDDIKRTVRRIATKAGKQLDKKNAEIAGLKHQNASLASQLASSARSGRKKVQYNPNGHFAPIQEIVKAQNGAEANTRKNHARHGEPEDPTSIIALSSFHLIVTYFGLNELLEDATVDAGCAGGPVALIP